MVIILLMIKYKKIVKKKTGFLKNLLAHVNKKHNIEKDTGLLKNLMQKSYLLCLSLREGDCTNSLDQMKAMTRAGLYDVPYILTLQRKE